MDLTLLDFWSWSASDLVSNATRGRLAEFIVANALGVESGIREEWAAYDLATATGIKIEVNRRRTSKRGSNTACRVSAFSAERRFSSVCGQGQAASGAVRRSGGPTSTCSHCFTTWTARLSIR